MKGQQSLSRRLKGERRFTSALRHANSSSTPTQENMAIEGNDTVCPNSPVPLFYYKVIVSRNYPAFVLELTPYSVCAALWKGR
jgi:hypothetical protein